MWHRRNKNDVEALPALASQINDEGTIIARVQEALARGDLSAVRGALERQLDDLNENSPRERAVLTLSLARVLAAQGNLAQAVELLQPVQDEVQDRVGAAHIYCARAIELVYAGKLEKALDLVSSAEHLGPEDPHVQANIAEIYDAVVPVLLLAQTGAAAVSDALAARVLDSLVRRLVATPNNFQLAHVVALLAERSAIREDVRALESAVQHAESGASHRAEDSVGQATSAAWTWAIICWVLLSFNEAYWSRWHRRLIERRGEVASGDGGDGGGSGVHDAALARIRPIHERLRAIYQQPSSPLLDRARGEWHRRYLIEIEVEHSSAEALAELMKVGPGLLREVGFVGPVAGIGLLTVVGRSDAIRGLIVQHPSTEGADARDLSAGVKPIVLLRECLSPYAQMYAMHRMGWSQEAEEYSRSLAETHPEPRSFLCSLLIERAQDAFEGGNIEDARKTCIEAMHLNGHADAAAALLAKLSDARSESAMSALPPDFDKALKLAREDLAVVPAEPRLRAVVARVLRRHAQHRRDLLGQATPDVVEARRISALQNEAWELDPHPEDPDLVAWTVFGSAALLLALLANDEIAQDDSARLREAEIIVGEAERRFPGAPEAVMLRVVLLHGRVDRYLGNASRVARLRGGDMVQIETLARDVERAWSLQRQHDTQDRDWTAACFAALAEISTPATGLPSSLAPYDTGLALIARGLRLVPQHPTLIDTQAELLRIKANAVIHLEGGYDSRSLRDAAKRYVVNLYAQSWNLNSTVAERALAMARSCALIGEIVAAKWYAQAAVMLDPDNAEALDLWALIDARPAFESAARDSDYAEQHIRQQRYREAAGYLKRAIVTLSNTEYSPSWEAFVELHQVISHNLGVLRQFGFW